MRGAFCTRRGTNREDVYRPRRKRRRQPSEREVEEGDWEGVALFFALFLPQMWLWMLTNYRYNGFDAEDISFELVNVLLMVGVMGLATNLKGCFCSLMTREDSWFLSYSNSSSTFAPV